MHKLDKRLKRTIQVLMLLMLIPIASIGAKLYQSYIDIVNIREVYTDIQKTNKDSEWYLIKSILTDRSNGVKNNLKAVKNDSINAIFNNYDANLTGLRDDIESTNPDNKLYYILSPIVRNHNYDIRSIDKNNKLWIATENGILVDDDITSSSSNAIRSWEDEISKSHNPSMARNSLNKILSKDTSEINYIDPSRNDHAYKLNNEGPSYSNLEEEFRNSGVKSISSYNVIVCDYIYDNSDIFGIPDVGYRGVRNHNDTIILGEQYSIECALKPYEKVIDNFENLNTKYITLTDNMIYNVIFNMISTILILLVSIIGIIGTIFLFYKWGGISDGSSIRNNQD